MNLKSYIKSLAPTIRRGSALSGANKAAAIADQMSPQLAFARRLCERAGIDTEALLASDEFALKRIVDARRNDPKVAVQKRIAELDAQIAELESHIAANRQTLGFFSRKFELHGIPAITEKTSPIELRANLESYMKIAAREQLMKLGLISPDDVPRHQPPPPPPEVTGLARTQAILKAIHQSKAV